MKRMNKIIGALVAASLLSATPAWAEQKDVNRPLSVTKIPKEMMAALKKVTKTIPELADLHVRQVNIVEENEGHPEQWGFSLSSNKNDRRSGKEEVYAEVTLDANTGELYEFYLDNPNKESEKTPTEAFAKKKAAEFLESIFESKASDYRLKDIRIFDEGHDRDDDDEDKDEDDDDDYDYDSRHEAYMVYELVIKKIPVEDFDLDLTVDGEGRITDFENEAIVSVDRSKFPKSKRAISKTKATAAYEKLLNMSLVYEYDYEEDGNTVTNRPVLAYEPSFYGALDAFTGKASKNVRYWEKQEPKRIALSPKGEESFIHSREEAEALLARSFGISFADLQFREEEEDDDDDYEESDIITYVWKSTSDEDLWVRVWLTFNKETGKILHFEFEDETDEEDRQDEDEYLSHEDALQTAVQTLEAFLKPTTEEVQLSHLYDPFEKSEPPAWVDEDELPDDDDDWDGYNNYGFYFDDVYQGVPVAFSGYMVEVDPRTGKIRELYLNNEDDLTSLPDNKNTVSPGKAAESYLDYSPLQLTYVWPRYMDQKAPKPFLLYYLSDKQYRYIDAYTGEVIPEVEE